jgi:hypothetical protein
MLVFSELLNWFEAALGSGIKTLCCTPAIETGIADHLWTCIETGQWLVKYNGRTGAH